MSNLGAGTSVGIGEESTWATGVSRTNWRRPISANAQRDFPLIPTGTIGTGFYTKDVDGNETAALTTVFEITYENFGMWLEKCLYATASTSGPSGTQYTHVLNQSATEPVGTTVEVIEGDTGNALVMQGGMVSSFELSFGVAQAYSQLTINWIGQDIAISGSPSTPSYGSGEESIIAKQGSTLSWDSATYCFRSMTIRGDNAIERRFCVGSTYTEKPVQGASPRTILVDFELDYVASIDTKYAALTEANGTITFTGSGDNELEILLRNMKLVSVSKPIANQGRITQRVTARCRENPAGTFPLQLAVKNANSAGDAN